MELQVTSHKSPGNFQETSRKLHCIEDCGWCLNVWCWQGLAGDRRVVWLCFVDTQFSLSYEIFGAALPPVPQLSEPR